MTTYHLAGANQEQWAAATEGHPILITYADVLKNGPAMKNSILPRVAAGRYSSVICDSGAFSVISAGITVDIHEYAAWARDHRELFDVIVNLDSIAGDLAESRRNLEILTAAGLNPLPVFHEGEPWAELEGMARDHDHLGLGYARLPGGRMKSPRKARLAWAREALARVGDRARTHGFAMTRDAMLEDLPFTTTDSTTWISEYRGLRSRHPRPYAHGCEGELAAMLDSLPREALEQMVIQSYRHPVWAADAPAPFTGLARGQARTALRRLGARRFWEIAFAHAVQPLTRAA